MPVDQPPPVVITALAAPPEEAEEPSVYGPPDDQNASFTKQEVVDCPQVREDEIVVCGPVDSDQYLLGPDLPTSATAMEDIGGAIRKIKIGPIEVDPNLRPRDSAGIGVRIRF